MKNIEALVRGRRSVRNYKEKPIEPEVMEKLAEFIAELDNPYGIAVDVLLRDAGEYKLSCPVAPGVGLFACGRVKRCQHMNEAFGYSFEKLVLFCRSLGLGTVWVGGTMDRAAFENAADLADDEAMPCMSPVGYPAEKMALREIMMRKAIKADERMDFSQLFFDGSFDRPLSSESAGELFKALEMVRLAPSAVNKQPWRIVLDGKTVHFYLQRSKGFGGGALDMQKIDMGIALCHFDLAAREQGFEPRFAVDRPDIPAEGLEYIATYHI